MNRESVERNLKIGLAGALLLGWKRYVGNREYVLWGDHSQGI